MRTLTGVRAHCAGASMVLAIAAAVFPADAGADDARAPAAAVPHIDTNAPFRALFPFHDGELLLPGESNGGALFVPSHVPAGARLPLVVLIHGVNGDHGPHMWLGGRDFTDLGPLVDRLVAMHASLPFILAAPSQTRNAYSGHAMWKDFDLDDFVHSVEGALGSRATVDRADVVVMGHSGAGCNPDGGLLRAARSPGSIVPRAVVAIDTCLDEESGDALGRAPASVEVWVRWEPEIWPRPIDRFRAAFRDAANLSGRDEPTVQRVDNLGPYPHEAIVPDTFTALVPSLVAPHVNELDVPAGASDP